MLYNTCYIENKDYINFSIENKNGVNKYYKNDLWLNESYEMTKEDFYRKVKNLKTKLIDTNIYTLSGVIKKRIYFYG